MIIYAPAKLETAVEALSRPVAGSNQLHTSDIPFVQKIGIGISGARHWTDDLLPKSSEATCRYQNLGANFSQALLQVDCRGCGPDDSERRTKERAQDIKHCINNSMPRGQVNVLEEDPQGVEAKNNSPSRLVTKNHSKRAYSVVMETQGIFENILISVASFKYNRSKSQESRQAACPQDCFSPKERKVRRKLTQFLDSFFSLGFLEHDIEIFEGSVLELQSSLRHDEVEESSEQEDIESVDCKGWHKRHKSRRSDIELKSIAVSSSGNCHQTIKLINSDPEVAKDLDSNSMQSMIHTIPESEEGI